MVKLYFQSLKFIHLFFTIFVLVGAILLMFVLQTTFINYVFIHLFHSTFICPTLQSQTTRESLFKTLYLEDNTTF